jgi:hypothetical protein
MISRGWPCPTDSLKGRKHSNHPFSARPALHRQESIFKIKSAKINFFIDFPSPDFAYSLREITQSVYMVQVVRPKKRRMFNKFYFPI